MNIFSLGPGLCNQDSGFSSEAVPDDSHVDFLRANLDSVENCNPQILAHDPEIYPRS